MQKVPVPMHWVGKDGTILWANTAHLDLLGYAPEEIIGHNISAFTDDANEILERFRREENLQDFETRLRRKDGTVREVAINSDFHYDNGELLYARCVSREVREAHHALEVQARLAAIVESSDDAIVSKDLQGFIQSWNRGAEQMFGYRADEVIGRHISLLAPPERAQDIPRILERIARGERVEHFETTRRTKDGRLLTVSLSVSPIRDHAGRVIGASKIARDITSLKRLSEVQARLAAIVESADDAIISKDLQGYVQSWNGAAERLFGYTAEEMIGKHISVLAPPDRVDEIPRILERIGRGERFEHYETRRRTKDGRILTVSLTISPVRDSSGVVIAASKIARDITEQKHLMELGARMAAIVESSDDAIISKDLDGYIQSWNRGAERLFGYKAEEIVGKHISTLAAPESADEIPGILARLREGERVEHYRTKRCTKDGRILTVSLTISPVRNASGVIIGISKIARDVTEQVQSEAALQAANEALARSNADLEQFAYSASHDLQEPLRTIAAYIGLLRRRFTGQLGTEGEEYLQYTMDGVKRMHQLLRDLLDFTRASTFTETPNEDVDANIVLTEVLENLKTAITDSGASITFSTLPAVTMHRVHLQQVLQNLIANAIRYRSTEAPCIHVSGERRGSDWVFSVRDNGIGIDAKYHSQIFGIFKRLHTTAAYPGTGMGLAICQRLVQRAHGRIWVESELGRGSTFYFTIPAGNSV